MAVFSQREQLIFFIMDPTPHPHPTRSLPRPVEVIFKTKSVLRRKMLKIVLLKRGTKMHLSNWQATATY
jgi:hypothetical protein